MVRLAGGLMATINAPDYGKVPLHRNQRHEGRAFVKRMAVTIESDDGKTENWPAASDRIKQAWIAP